MFKKIRFYILSEAVEEAKDPKTGTPAMIKSCGVKLIELQENGAQIVNDVDDSFDRYVHVWVCESTVWRFNWFKLRYGYYTNEKYNLDGIPTLLKRP